MKNTSGFTFGHLLLIIILFASVISCNQDEVIAENQNLIGRWKDIDHSESFVHQLIFESDSTYKYEISIFISIATPKDISGPLSLLASTETYIGQYFINGRNLSLQADTKINTDFIFESSDTIKINSLIYEECKFEIVDTILTLRYTTYRANTPITSTTVFLKNNDQDLETRLNAR